MNKTIYRITSIIMLLAQSMSTFSNVQASPQYSAFYEQLAVGDSAGWNFDKSGALETITPTSEGWLCQAGGNVADTHYARMRYKLPETVGRVLTTFYMKAVIVLPSDFYTQQETGFRLLNTDNFATTLNGQQVGGANTNELRAAVYLYSDHKLRVIVDHENVAKKILYKASAPIPVGEHTFELYGSLSEVAPWYFKLDGAVLASGVERLSPDSVPVNERVATRVNVGIDGAANQDQKPMSLLVKSFEVADYDMSGSNPAPIPVQPTSTPLPPTTTIVPTTTSIQPTATVIAPTTTPIQPTATVIAPTATQVQPTSTTPPQTPVPIQPTVTVLPTNTAVIQPTAISNGSTERIYDDKNPLFVYSIGWSNISNAKAFNRSYKETTRNGASVTFPFSGQSFTIIYKGGISSSEFDIFVDGTKVGTVNQNLSAATYNQRWDYPGQLLPGTHTLKLVFHKISSTKRRGSLDAVIVR